MRILVFLFAFSIVTIASADVYVITAPDKTVYSLSEQDDAVVPKGYKKDVLKNKVIKDLPVTAGQENMYDFDGGKFSINVQKFSEAQEKVISDAGKANELVLIDKKMQFLAYQALENDGYKFKHISDNDFK